MNGNGKADLVGLSTNYGAGATVLLGNGDGTFQPAMNGPGIANYPSVFAVGDFNGDGRPDVATVYLGGVALQLGNGDGPFQASIQTILSFLPGYLRMHVD